MFTKSCCMCQHLDIKKKEAGTNSGNLYYCKKYKSFINPYHESVCENYEKDWGRKHDTIIDIEEDSKKYDNSSTNIKEPILALLLIISMGIVILIFG